MELGLAADVGTLQRLPKVVGNQSWVRDIVYTARKVSAEEAFQFGLVRYVYPSPSLLPQTYHALSLAKCVWTKRTHSLMLSKLPKILPAKVQWPSRVLKST